MIKSIWIWRADLQQSYLPLKLSQGEASCAFFDASLLLSDEFSLLATCCDPKS